MESFVQEKSIFSCLKTATLGAHFLAQKKRFLQANLEWIAGVASKKLKQKKTPISWSFTVLFFNN